jgi:ubiquitin fusion degradation protein 1
MLSGLGRASTSSSGSKSKEKQETASSQSWGSGGQTLGSNSGPASYGAGGARVPQPPRRQGSSKKSERERSPTPDFGVDDDDIIDVDSD